MSDQNFNFKGFTGSLLILSLIELYFIDRSENTQEMLSISSFIEAYKNVHPIEKLTLLRIVAVKSYRFDNVGS